MKASRSVAHRKTQTDSWTGHIFNSNQLIPLLGNPPWHDVEVVQVIWPAERGRESWQAISPQNYTHNYFMYERGLSSVKPLIRVNSSTYRITNLVALQFGCYIKSLLHFAFLSPSRGWSHGWGRFYAASPLQPALLSKWTLCHINQPPSWS